MLVYRLEYSVDSVSFTTLLHNTAVPLSECSSSVEGSYYRCTRWKLSGKVCVCVYVVVVVLRVCVRICLSNLVVCQQIEIDFMCKCKN